MLRGGLRVLLLSRLTLRLVLLYRPFLRGDGLAERGETERRGGLREPWSEYGERVRGRPLAGDLVDMSVVAWCGMVWC